MLRTTSLSKEAGNSYQIFPIVEWKRHLWLHTFGHTETCMRTSEIAQGKQKPYTVVGLQSISINASVAWVHREAPACLGEIWTIMTLRWALVSKAFEYDTHIPFIFSGELEQETIEFCKSLIQKLWKTWINIDLTSTKHKISIFSMLRRCFYYNCRYNLPSMYNRQDWATRGASKITAI